MPRASSASRRSPCAAIAGSGPRRRSASARPATAVRRAAAADRRRRAAADVRDRHRPGLGRTVEPRPRRDLRRLSASSCWGPARSGSTRRPRSATPRADRSTGSSSTPSPPASAACAPAGHRRRRRRSRPRSATRRSSCRSAASCRPVARPSSGSATGATLRTQPGRLELAVHQGQRDRRPVPLAALGQPPRSPSTGRTTATRSRPRPALRPGPDRHRPQLVLATTGDRTAVSADGLTQTFAATNVRDFTVTAATDFRTAVAGRARHDRPGLLPPGRARRGDARCRGGRLRGPPAPAGPYPHPIFKVVQSAGGYGMESPGLDLDPDRRRLGQPALPGRPRDGPPVVLRDRRQRPGDASRSPTRPPPTSSPATSWGCGAPAAARPAGSIVRSTSTRRPATTRRSTSRAATCSTTRAGGWARRAFWAALRGYISVTSVWARHRRRTLLYALDAATPLDLGATRCSTPRFPRLLASSGGAGRRRSAGPRRSAWGICRNDGRQRSDARPASRPPASAETSARGDPRQAVVVADRSRQQADRRPQRPGVDRRPARRQPGASGPSGGRRTTPPARGRRAATRTGSGRAEHVRHVRVERRRDPAGSSASGTPNARPIGRVSS